MSQTILLVEDDLEINRINRKVLEMKGYRVVEAEKLSQARALLESEKPDLILLDIMLPDGDGLSFCRELRGESQTPVLFLSGLAKKPEIVTGLSAGGDDYLPKPYDLNELLARVDSLLRRAAQVPQYLTKGTLKLDIAANQAFLNGQDMLLAQKDFALLSLFVQNENRNMSAEYLYEKVWKASLNGDARAVQYHISILRKKLADSGYTIVSQRNEGYTFEKS